MNKNIFFSLLKRYTQTITAMQSKKFSLTRQLKSFTYAIAGIRGLIISEHNARVHAAATIAVIILSFALKISATEWLAIVIVTGFVWAAEMFNTSVEKIMDFISMEKNAEIKFIKDVSAGAVLVASATAVAAGLIIFIPKIL
jgi:diacylglycerol kinase (ATP)